MSGHGFLGRGVLNTLKDVHFLLAAQLLFHGQSPMAESLLVREDPMQMDTTGQREGYMGLN